MKRSIKSSQIEMLQFELIKGGLGTPTLAGPAKLQCTITDNGVGDYTIGWKPAYMQTPVIMVTPVTDGIFPRIHTVANDSVRIVTKNFGVPSTAAVGTLDLTTDVVLTKAALGAAKNGNTVTLQVIAAAANPTDTVLAVFSGTEAATTITVTPNDGTNNITTAGVKSTAIIDLSTDVNLERAVTGAASNTNTVTLQVLAAAANPTDTVLMAVAGTAAATTITITPNDGTNNAATPVNMTGAQLALAIAGKVSATYGGIAVTITDGGSLLNNFTATGGGAVVLADAGEGDGEVATFAGGVTQVNTAVGMTSAQLRELINSGSVVGINVTLTDASALRTKFTALGGGAQALADAGEGDGKVATFAGGADNTAVATEADFHVLVMGSGYSSNY